MTYESGAHPPPAAPAGVFFRATLVSWYNAENQALKNILKFSHQNNSLHKIGSKVISKLEKQHFCLAFKHKSPFRSTVDNEK